MYRPKVISPHYSLDFSSYDPSVFSEQFRVQADRFLTDLFDKLSTEGVSLDDRWDIDHICYRVETEKSYDICKKYLLKNSSLICESEIAGRPISTFRLSSPICWKGRKIDLLELPSPKSEKPYIDGFEHIEVVTDLSFSEIWERFSNGRGENLRTIKPFNAECSIQYSSGTIKFHHLSLDSVIRLESNPQVMKIIEKNGLLELIQSWTPILIENTQHSQSPQCPRLQILIAANQFEDISDLIYKLFPNARVSQNKTDSAQSAYIQDNSLECMLIFTGPKIFQHLSFQRAFLNEKLIKYTRFNTGKAPNEWLKNLLGETYSNVELFEYLRKMSIQELQSWIQKNLRSLAL